MRITELIMENILKIKVLHIVPKEDVNEVKGGNAQGKSSVLDAIVIGFRGKKGAPAEVVHRGSKKGSIILKLDGDPAVYYLQQGHKR